jgi:membrane-bound lytic murein transglycosylase D
MALLPRLLRLAPLGLAALVAACAQQPTEPVSSLPEAVIRNVPADRQEHEPQALPVPVEKAPIDDDLPPVPIEYPDVMERIRAGFRLPDVQHPWVQSEYNWYVRNADYMARVFGRAQRYLHHIANEVEARGLPMELALLPVVESAFNPFAYSRSHASGLWQFIPGTGRLYGLPQDYWMDQRRDVLESTRAALEYLSYLHDKHGDWFLAVASYNFGGGNINRAISRNRMLGRDTDFFALALPRETRAYVPKLIALARIVRDPVAHGLTPPRIPDAPYFRVIETGGPVDLRLAASLAGIDVEELHALNPGWNQWVTAPDGPHRLLVPVAVADQFEARFAALAPHERANLAKHGVAPGDTLASLARRHQVPVSFLQAVNGTDGAELAVGSELLVPAGTVEPLRPNLVRSPTSVHIVKSGESLWSISRRYGMTVDDLAKANKLKKTSTLRPGQRLTVRSSGSGGGTVVASAGPAEAGGTRTISYKVRRGDTLSSIARRFAVSVKDLMAWNGLKNSDIKRGQRLKLHVDSRRDFGG